MKKITAVAIILLTFIFVSHVSAQQDSLSQRRNEKLLTQAQKNSARLALTPEQKKPFAEINDKYKNKALELKKNSFSREARIEGIKNLDVEKDAEMQVLLTPAQFKVYKDIIDKRRQEMEAARNRQLKIKE